MSYLVTKPPFDPHTFFAKFLFWVSILILFLVVFGSCSCDYHLRKAANKCGIHRMTDTTFVHDTIITSISEHDTTFYFNQIDTVVIREGKLVMKYYYRDSTVYLKGQCLPDTVFYEKQIITNSLELKSDPLVKYRWWIISLFLVLLIIAILRK